MFAPILRAQAEAETSTGSLAGFADRRLAPAFARRHAAVERELITTLASGWAAFALGATAIGGGSSDSRDPAAEER